MAKYYPKKDYLSNLVAQYKFEDNDNICRDSSGNDNNGTYYGTTKIVENGKTSRNFNGTSDYIQFNKTITPANDLSIKFDIKCTDVERFSFVFTNSYSSSDNGVLIQIKNNKIDCIFLNKLCESNNGLVSANLNENTWNSILITKKDKVIKMYKNNLAIPISTSEVLYDNNPCEYNLKIGDYSYAHYYYKGNLSNLEIYNKAIEFTDNKYLIQDKDNILYTLNENNLVQAPSQILDEHNFNSNGFTDINLITKDLLLSKFENLEGIKLLAYTHDLEKNKCEMTYNCHPFRPIDKLKKNSDICNILFKEV
ncbi:hypothetical protein ACP49_16615 [Clostridium botulinum]|uniref:LamG-like jellyroll fold domain-containing protein n=1 Tax=Clostridium botulinum TaxID=1491 RepID=UPI0005F9A65B|nr:LamG-like jellyroll fold domain-containing protein [Clostridium botulinum]KOM97150.1 hypothetical protein ACP53_11790 [Clostridium botulinum]KOM99567.1 hypothetical protein ACP49_16615 [Clostridium botulinum]MBY7004473.1 LamG domain-containing protein [Clostridium botulinum]MCR1147136.1 LamG domain-containing protein [Clostridium botulinum]NFH94589.1 LamG domain-containing protein [Clostridium botulinum]